MILTRTPLRISLGGGGTDLPFYCQKFGASLVYGAINKYMYITASRRVQKDIKLNYSKTELVERVEDIEHPLIKEALKHVGILNDIEIHSVSDIPSGTGLGSSSAFLVGLLNALYYSRGQKMSNYELAEDASYILMDRLKEPCGKQDQYASAFGNICHLSIEPSGKTSVTLVHIPHDALGKLEANLMLFYTGFTRNASEVLRSQKETIEHAKEDLEEKLRYFHEIKRLGEESLKCLENGNLTKFGEYLDVHWQLKKQTSEMMTNTKLDSYYALAKSKGALGGKIVGAGGGGFLMLYVEAGHDKLRKAMKTEGLIEVPFKFDFEGTRVVYDGNNL
jgi:D-glycero-alpha-D-manno-heptose-7-phosphate kinase